jgi:hypothetical protein
VSRQPASDRPSRTAAAAWAARERETNVIGDEVHSVGKRTAL